MSDDDFGDGEEAVRLAIEAQLTDAPKPELRVVRGGPKGGGGKRQGEPKAFVDTGGRFVESRPPTIAGLPEDGPVRALGTFQNRVYFLDAHSQLRELAAKDVSRTMILHLFGPDADWIYRLWPTMKHVAKTDTWVITGWDATKAQESLMRAVAQRGIWKPQDHVRGRGTWDTGDGRLVVHSGNRLHFGDGSWTRPGMVEGQVYPAANRSIEPAVIEPDALSGRDAADELLDLLESWHWARHFDARLLLGWTVASMMGGALKVRPLVWVTGEKGTGKSSLVGEGGVIHKLFGPGILMTANTTAAGLYQKIEYDSLPVAVDEIEAKRGNQKTEAVIELARQAYSGGMVLRGGADHEGKEFRAMCPVLFGSILIPPLMPQDLSRLALLNLKPFDPLAKEPKIDTAHLARIGRAMLRRVLTHWPQWGARFAAWHAHLRAMGHDGRAADQFGTLLAAADLVLRDELPDAAHMAMIAGDMSPMKLQETQVESSNAARCIGYAMSRPLVSMRGGEHMMVAELVTCAVRRYGGEMESPIKQLDAVRFLERAGVSVVVQVMRADKLVGLKPMRVNPGDLDAMLDAESGSGEVGVFVAFAPDGDGILELFRGSDWEGVAGAHNPYIQALERVEGARKATFTIKIGMRSCRPILVPIAACVDLPSAAEAAQAAGA